MKIKDKVYCIHEDHICICLIQGIEEFDGDTHYHLYSTYTHKMIDHWVSEHCVFANLTDMTEAHIGQHHG